MACEACMRNEGNCVRKDDMAEVLDKMLAADVIVMATPVYFYTMNAQMKTLIDRTFPKCKRMYNKEMYFIATAADPRKEPMERTIDAFRGFISCLGGAKEKGIIFGTGVSNKGDIKRSKAMDQAYEMGKAL